MATDNGPVIQIDPGSLRKLIQASRTWDAVSRREMRANLRAAASMGAESAKRTVRGLPAKGMSTGLRTGLAGGVKVSIRSGREAKDGVVKGEGVRVTTTSAKLPGNKEPMVKAYMAKKFRHPVFGHRVYVEQKGHDWFYRPLTAGRDEYAKAIVDAIEAAAKALDD